ncbi:MAG TPA: dihydroorotase [Polyangia bacterium]|nr:dihydroorotase [Polyangia bacterium]
MPRTLLIANARIVAADGVLEGDVLVRGERIESVGTDLAGCPADEVIDAAGRHLFPGLIDDHVHFREPGAAHKGDIASESRAAVAGGTTSFMEMPNTAPATTTRAALEAKHALAAASSMANWSFYLGATNQNLDEIRALEPSADCGIKVFMGASTGDLLVDDPAALDGVFREARVPVATHCEHTPTIEFELEAWRARRGDDIPMSAHPQIRSAEACFVSTSLAVELARQHGTRLHVLHLTTARELDLFESGPLAAKRISAEVCAHHLHFCDEDYERLGTRIKCNPAIKTRADRDALRAALAEGRIDVVATDHAPHTLEEKDRPYLDAPAGLPSIQHSLSLLVDLHRQGVLTLGQIAERGALAPARLFGVKDRGAVAEGFFADLVLVDLDRPHTVIRENVLHKCGWSAFEGHAFSSTVALTLVNGRVAYRDGRFDGTVRGRRLEFTR